MFHKIFISLFFVVLLGSSTMSQEAQMNEKLAKQAVYNIVKYSGLAPNFVVLENSEVKTAIAFIKNKKRYIEYNPEILTGILDSTNTDWSAVSIMAHEIGHHFLGHTLDPNKIRPGDEMACDRYSGFILQSMGASLEESLAAMEQCGSVKGTKNHPPKKARLEAISQGWEESKRLQNQDVLDWGITSEHFKFVVRFEGDENNYYVNEQNKLVWFDNYAEPIEFGEFKESLIDNYEYSISWEDFLFHVDSQNVIWNLTQYNVHMTVGELKSYESD